MLTDCVSFGFFSSLGTLLSVPVALTSFAITSIFLAALPVVLVALKTRSLLWCCIVGVVTYGLLLLIPL